jgi:hypothetical protein
MGLVRGFEECKANGKRVEARDGAERAYSLANSICPCSMHEQNIVHASTLPLSRLKAARRHTTVFMRGIVASVPAGKRCQNAVGLVSPEVATCGRQV